MILQGFRHMEHMRFELTTSTMRRTHDLYNAKRKQDLFGLAGMCRIVRKISVSGLRSPHIVKEHTLSFQVKITHLLPKPA